MFPHFVIIDFETETFIARAGIFMEHQSVWMEDSPRAHAQYDPRA